MPLSPEKKAGRLEASAFYIGVVSAWEWYFKGWFAVYYVLGLLLISCSALAASASQIMCLKDYAPTFSVVVVILTGTIGLLSPQDRGSRYRQAWSLLRVQLSRFHYDPTYTLDDVVRAYEQGEAIIHQALVTPRPPRLGTPEAPAPGAQADSEV